MVQGDVEVCSCALGWQKLSVTLRGHPHLCNCPCTPVPLPAWEGKAFQISTCACQAEPGFPVGQGMWATPQALQLLGKEQVLGIGIALSWACSEAATFARLSSSHSPIVRSWGVFSRLTVLVQDTEWPLMSGAPQGLWQRALSLRASWKLGRSNAGFWFTQPCRVKEDRSCRFSYL